MEKIENRPKNTQSELRTRALNMIFNGNKKEDLIHFLYDNLNKIGTRHFENTIGKIVGSIYAFCYFDVSHNTVSNNFTYVKDVLKKYEFYNLQKKEIDFNLDEKQKAKNLKKANQILELIEYPLYNLKRELLSEKINNQLENPQDIDLKYFNELILKIKEAIQTKKYLYFSQSEERTMSYHKLIYLICVTGRRFIEIMKTLELEKKDNKIYFGGLAKKRESKEMIIEAYLLDNDYETLKTWIKDIRNFFQTEKFSNQQINQKYSAIFNAWLEKAGIPKQLTAKEFRNLYAYEAYERFGKPKGTDRYYFFIKCLGHNVDLTENATSSYVIYGNQKPENA